VALSNGGDPLVRAGTGLVSGAAGFVITVFEMAVQGPGRAVLQKLPFSLLFALRTLVYGAVFSGMPALAQALVATLSPSPAMTRALGLGLGKSIMLALAFNTLFAARALLGPRTLIAFAMGRYHRPRREQRLVLFLDLRGSTGLAERLGDLEFHRFLNHLVGDLSDPVAEADGEIYRYVGDEFIVTWNGGESGGAAVTCLFAIEDTLARRSADYAAQFGAVPRLRGALHAGPLVVGEMGEVKREIVILGDTMNTAARILEVCRDTGRDHIASAAALAAVATLPPGLKAEPLGSTQLRGKAERIELFAIVRAACGEASAEQRPQASRGSGGYRRAGA
jgi:adenylate cyclase